MEWAQFSPDAKHVVIGAASPNPDSRCYRIAADAFLVALPGGPAVPLPACPAAGDSLALIATDAAWAPGGNRFILAVMDQDLSLPYEQRQDAGHYQAYVVNGTSFTLDGGPVNLGIFLPGDRSGTSEGHTTNATGETMTFEETYWAPPNPASCYLVTRDAHYPFAVKTAWAFAVDHPYSDVVCQTPVQTNVIQRRPLALRH